MVADGTYNVSGTKSGVYLQTWYPNVRNNIAAEKIVVALGTNETVDIAMTPGHVLSGTVSAASGSPISGATVLLSNGMTALTDASGTYTVTGINTGTHTASYIAYGYATVTTSVSMTADVARNQALTPVGASSGLKGTITKGAANAPVAGATVRIWSEGRQDVLDHRDHQRHRPVLPGHRARRGLPGRCDQPAEPGPLGGQRRLPHGATTYTLTTACTSTPDPAGATPAPPPST